MNKFIVSIILLLVGIGLTLSFTRGFLVEKNQIDTEIAGYDRALAQAKTLSELKRNLLEKYNSIPADQRERIEKFLPRNLDTVRLTIEIDNIAKQNGIALSGFSYATIEVDSTTDANEVDGALLPSEEGAGQSNESLLGDSIETNAGYSAINMSFTANGTYENMKDFLEALETNLRLTDVMSLSISGEEGNSISSSIVIKTYWLGT